MEEKDDGAIKAWVDKGDELFTDLLYSLGISFGFPFDRVQLTRGIYSPRAHSDSENQQMKIQINLARLLAGEQPLNMNVVGFPVCQEALDRQQALQDALIKALDLITGIPVNVNSNKRLNI